MHSNSCSLATSILSSIGWFGWFGRLGRLRRVIRVFDARTRVKQTSKQTRNPSALRSLGRGIRKQLNRNSNGGNSKKCFNRSNERSERQHQRPSADAKRASKSIRKQCQYKTYISQKRERPRRCANTRHSNQKCLKCTQAQAPIDNRPFRSRIVRLPRCSIDEPIIHSACAHLSLSRLCSARLILPKCK